MVCKKKLFYGISTAISLQLIKRIPSFQITEDFFLKKYKEPIKEITSALFHDYFKDPNQKLENFFDLYNSNSNIAKAKQLENELDFHNKPENSITVKKYHAHIRPCLKLIYMHKDISWIGHGLETPSYELVKQKYPIFTTKEFGEWFCIENGRPPFYCNSHGSNHKCIYGSIRCWTPANIFAKYGQIINTGNTPVDNRDHLLIKGSSPSQQWIAVYRDGFEDQREIITRSNLLGPISESNIKLFLKTVNLIIDRFYCLNINKIK